MPLPPEDVEQFYHVMLPLLFFVTQNSGLAPEITDWEGFLRADIQVKSAACDRVYETPELFDAFLDSNPDGMSADDLQIVRQWKDGHVAGSFFVERHLKNHSIWIGGDEGSQIDAVYAVHSLGTPLEQLIPKGRLPMMVKTGLLPFKGRTVYDGLLRYHNISFGSGYRGRLRETYMIAKQNGTIIEHLDGRASGGKPVSAPASPRRDWTPEVEALKKTAAKLRGEKHPLTKEAFAACRKCIDLVEETTSAPDNLEGIIRHCNQLIRAVRRLQTVVDRTR